MSADPNPDDARDRQRLIAAARRLLDTQADAEDAVQDAYLRALIACPNSLRSRPAWLCAVLRNLAIDRLRRRRFERDHVSGRLRAELNSALAPSRQMAWTAEIRSECMAALRHLLRQVSPAQAAAIILREVFEFEFADIARIAGKSDAAARQFLHRALSRARRTGRQPKLCRENAGDEEAANEAAKYVELCWRAVESRDPAVLFEMIETTTAYARPIAVAAGGKGAASASTTLVHVNGQYALALVLDGIVLCVIPVGTTAREAVELA